MRTLALVVCLACLGTSLLAGPRARLSADLTWDNPGAWFGGFSGAEVTDGGSLITLLTDRGTLATARLIRNAGRLTGVQLQGHKRLRKSNGRKLRNLSADAEGLAIGDSGMAYVSFEQRTRVAQVNLSTGKTNSLPIHPDFKRFDANKGPEALALHPDGTLYVVPERTATKRAPFPLYAFRDGSWRITHKIPRRGTYLVTGADFDRYGRLYLLERAITPVGFRSRVRRFDLNPASPSEVTVLTTLPGQFDNLEAISVWQSSAGQLVMTMISDDNFLSLQKTQIVEYVLQE